MNKYMKLAIDEAKSGMLHNHGGPFGCVIVKNGEVIGKGHNKVLFKNDPTLHSEMVAIKNACEKIKSYDLSGCELYVTGEPCPMCLCACMWANIEKIYYGCTLKDNSIIGFRDEKFDNLMGGRKNITNYLECIDRDKCLKLFDEYNKMNKQLY